MADVQGDFDLFATAFPNDLLPGVFRLMLNEWPNAPRPVDTPLENRITNCFVGHLQIVMRNHDMPRFKFHYRPKLPDVNSDSESGELDIEVDSFSPHPDAFLVVECKRLNVENKGAFKSLAGEYVGKEGMGCFLSDQYSSGGNVGAMLGYVMTRTIGEAMRSIDKQLSAKAAGLRLRAPHRLAQSTILPNDARIRQTVHDTSGIPFVIAHLFVQYQ